jgi:hypothetical protein
VWCFNNSLTSGAYAAFVSGVIDVQPNAMPNRQGAWYVPSFVSTLAAPASAGSRTVELAGAPTAGDILVLSPSLSNVEDDNLVTAVSGAGPFTVTFATTIGFAHAPGEPVAEAFTSDGLHPNQMGHLKLAVAVIAAKNAGKLR